MRAVAVAAVAVGLLATPTGESADAATKADVKKLRDPVVKIIAIGRRSVEVGTGFFIAPGTIATNRHVVGIDTANRRLFVLFRVSGKPVVYGGTKVAESDPLDLAVVKIKLTDHPVLKITTTVPDLDHPVISIGYPARLEAVDKDKLKQALREGGGLRALLKAYVSQLEQANVTTGNISKIDMTNWGFPNRSRLKAIFHTTSISGGNSGGPLVDRCGRVVGVNTRVLTAVRSSGTRDRTFAAYSQASQAKDLIGFLKKNNVPHQVETDKCTVAAPSGARGGGGMPVLAWAAIGVVGLLALASMGFAIVAPRRAKRVVSNAGEAMTQMTRRMGTTLNRPTAPRIREVRITGEGVDLKVGGAALSKGYVVGRDAALCDATLAVGNVSRRHFRLGVRAGRPTIEDLSSTNGTKIDDRELKPYEPMPVANGATLHIGATALRVSIG